MDAEQLVTHILRTEKQFKKGFDQLTDYVPGCEYYGLKCYNGQLFAYCRIFPRSIAQGFVEYEAEKPESVDSVQVKNYVQHMLKECFPNIPMKIQDREIGQIVSHAQKLLNNK